MCRQVILRATMWKSKCNVIKMYRVPISTVLSFIGRYIIIWKWTFHKTLKENKPFIFYVSTLTIFFRLTERFSSSNFYEFAQGMVPLKREIVPFITIIVTLRFIRILLTFLPLIFFLKLDHALFLILPIKEHRNGRKII